MMDRDEVCSRFLDVVPYELYPFQEEALLAWFESEGGVLVTAPTGMGKTLIAEAAIFEALQTNQRLYYTTPLIALTDQKFREFQDRADAWGFDPDRIGLVTGNRRVNPDANVRIVVAEILLNHLLSSEERLDDVSGVVMDEFHFFNDRERGVVWELSLMMLPAPIRLMLLSATVGNPVEFVGWMKTEHGRSLRLVKTNERRVPLAFEWVGERLLTEQLPTMVSDDDAENRSPALVFCFSRDECWAIAEKLKGLKLISEATRMEIESRIDPAMFADGIGPKLRQMLIRGVGVHHAGVLPKYKEIVENLFLAKLIPFVICTETLAAGINLPARSTVLTTLLKGKPRERKIVAPSIAHQIFGRAGRPQFDTQGYVYALAHEDDIKIAKWKKKYEQIDPNSKDPGLMRARKNMERKKPSRRKTQQYWMEGQFRNLIDAGPARLASRSMIPYQVLVHLLAAGDTLPQVRAFLAKRFNTPERIAKFSEQLDAMIDNLAAFKFLTKSEDGEHVTLSDTATRLVSFRSVDPLFGVFLAKQLIRGNFEEKVGVLESVLPLPPAIERRLRPPDGLEPGPMQTEVLEPMLIQLGLAITTESGEISVVEAEDEYEDYWAPEEDAPPRKLSPSEMLKLIFDTQLVTPEFIPVQPKFVAGGLFDFDCDFHKYVRSRDLAKNEGLVLRHMLRLVILASEFHAQSSGDPDYERIGEQATRVCRGVDERYTDRFLANEEDAKKLGEL